jgi:hypothetical protein
VGQVVSGGWYCALADSVGWQVACIARYYVQVVEGCLSCQVVCRGRFVCGGWLVCCCMCAVHVVVAGTVLGQVLSGFWWQIVCGGR